MCLAAFLLLAAAADPPLVIAHRGASHDAPENTVAAFQLAWERGADGIEADFFLSSDGRVVCTHDRTTERLVLGRPPLAVAETPFATLANLDVGSWKSFRFAGERMPLLSDVLATVPDDGRVFVEVKCGPEAIGRIAAEVRASGLHHGQVSVIAFDEAVVAAAREAIPGATANWLTAFEQDDAGRWSPTADEVLATLKRCGASGLGCEAEAAVVDAAFVARLRKAGYGWYVWTVNDPAAARRWADLGVDSITTDRPAVVKRAVGAARTVGATQ